MVLLVAAMPAARVLLAREERLGKPGAVREELAAGFRAIAGNRALRRATVTSMVSMAGLAMLIVAAPLLGLRLAGDAGYGALLLAVTAGAALAANAVIARVGVRWQSLRTGRQAGVARAGGAVAASPGGTTSRCRGRAGEVTVAASPGGTARQCRGRAGGDGVGHGDGRVHPVDRGGDAGGGGGGVVRGGGLGRCGGGRG
ncbi:hypothetical protein ACFSTC_18525 [Nonomuraea ferruginea]